MRKWLALAALAAVGAADTPTSISPLGLADLDGAALRQRSKKIDQFSNPLPDQVIAGRRFRIALPVMRMNTGEGLSSEGVSALWKYDATSQTLILKADSQMWSDLNLMLDDDKDVVHGFDGFDVRYSVINGKNYVGANAFGAQAVIHRYMVTILGLAYAKSSFDDNEGLPGTRSALGYSFAKDVPMAGERARAVTSSLKFVVEGQIINFASGTNVKCGSFEGGASMASRMDTATRYCLVAAKFDRVSFQDIAGDVIAEWRKSD